MGEGEDDPVGEDSGALFPADGSIVVVVVVEGIAPIPVPIPLSVTSGLSSAPGCAWAAGPCPPAPAPAPALAPAPTPPPAKSERPDRTLDTLEAREEDGLGNCVAAGLVAPVAAAVAVAGAAELD